MADRVLVIRILACPPTSLLTSLPRLLHLLPHLLHFVCHLLLPPLFTSNLHATTSLLSSITFLLPFLLTHFSSSFFHPSPLCPHPFSYPSPSYPPFYPPLPFFLSSCIVLSYSFHLSLYPSFSSFFPIFLSFPFIVPFPPLLPLMSLSVSLPHIVVVLLLLLHLHLLPHLIYLLFRFCFASSTPPTHASPLLRPLTRASNLLFR